MTPMDMMANAREQNGRLRGLTGSGQPGLYSLLGGTAQEQGASALTFTGGAGQVSATSRIAQAHRDTRLAAIAAGVATIPGRPGTGGGGGGGGDLGNNNPILVR